MAAALSAPLCHIRKDLILCSSLPYVNAVSNAYGLY